MKFIFAAASQVQQTFPKASQRQKFENSCRRYLATWSAVRF